MPNPPAESNLHIGQFLDQDRILLDLQSRQRDAVLEELVDAIEELKEHPRNRETLLHALKERESLCSTAVGDGVAFPHSRNALVGLVKNPVIVFGRSRNGIPFGAIDGQPATLFFLVVAPNVTTHLRILARLSRLVRDVRVRNELMKAEHASRVLSLVRVNEVNFDA